VGEGQRGENIMMGRLTQDEGRKSELWGHAVLYRVRVAQGKESENALRHK
jgi:hypothetical protein